MSAFTCMREHTVKLASKFGMDKHVDVDHMADEPMAHQRLVHHSCLMQYVVKSLET